MRRNPTMHPPGEFGRGLLCSMMAVALFLIGAVVLGESVMMIVLWCICAIVGALLLLVIAEKWRVYQLAKQFDLQGWGFFTVVLADTHESVDRQTWRRWLPDDWRELARVLELLERGDSDSFLVRTGPPYRTRIMNRCSPNDPTTMIALEEDVGVSGREELPLGVAYSMVTIDWGQMTARWEGVSLVKIDRSGKRARRRAASLPRRCLQLIEPEPCPQP